ncbi:hypothetical protein [Haliangium ochraceum]|uniref:Uncharacterized protein n=1 Tax=Haliangium ochraceum (strain DSM 14365 / JCM 11303 / SMP-2) TaxID=502025 RepID=D0LH03_HALO1|nr:hypothetical protein [Haliangium ochraceum]ACY14725.1 hypothetical protein Hoch_2180 [Haliangium ochraceum DSM 14365]
MTKTHRNPLQLLALLLVLALPAAAYLLATHEPSSVREQPSAAAANAEFDKEVQALRERLAAMQGRLDSSKDKFAQLSEHGEPAAQDTGRAANSGTEAGNGRQDRPQKKPSTSRPSASSSATSGPRPIVISEACRRNPLDC